MRIRVAVLPSALGPALVVLAWLAPERPARASDPFEIQVYDGTANAPGVPGLELHLNDWATGRRDTVPPERPRNGQFHTTLEPSLGVTSFWELGAYWQMAARTDDGVVDWAGVKLRSKFVTPPPWDAHWRLGANFELAYLPATYDRDQWGLEVRPIVAWHSERWLFAFNPILDQSLAGAGARSGPTFEPALKLARSVGPVALGVEYYGSLGPLASPLPPAGQEHMLFGAVDVLAIDGVELNAGVGAGLTQASAGVVLKAVLGYTFEGAASAPAPAGSVARRAPTTPR